MSGASGDGSQCIVDSIMDGDVMRESIRFPSEREDLRSAPRSYSHALFPSFLRGPHGEC